MALFPREREKRPLQERGGNYCPLDPLHTITLMVEGKKIFYLTIIDPSPHT